MQIRATSCHLQSTDIYLSLVRISSIINQMQEPFDDSFHSLNPACASFNRTDNSCDTLLHVLAPCKVNAASESICGDMQLHAMNLQGSFI